jgi:hypothetical protein
MLSIRGQLKEREQMGNPVKVLTSGVERLRTTEPRFLGGEWRFVERKPWWDAYTGPMVVFGHYWRPRTPGHSFTEDNLFESVDPLSTLGRGNAMCIDYGIGVRAEERIDIGLHGPFESALAALRCSDGEAPELVFSPV